MARAFSGNVPGGSVPSWSSALFRVQENWKTQSPRELAHFVAAVLPKIPMFALKIETGPFELVLCLDTAQGIGGRAIPAPPSVNFGGVIQPERFYLIRHAVFKSEKERV